AELLSNDDPYSLINYKIGMPGDGISLLYGRLLDISRRDDLTTSELERVLATMTFWEEAAIDVICDPQVYFTKTAMGNKGTASEFFGTSIGVNLSKSPNMTTGR